MILRKCPVPLLLREFPILHISLTHPFLFNLLFPKHLHNFKPIFSIPHPIPLSLTDHPLLSLDCLLAEIDHMVTDFIEREEPVILLRVVATTAGRLYIRSLEECSEAVQVLIEIMHVYRIDLSNSIDSMREGSGS